MIGNLHYTWLLKKEPTAYLCFTANTANCTVGIYKTGAPLASRVYYSTDGTNWYGMTGERDYTIARVGDRIYMKGDNASGWSTDGSNYWTIKVTGDVAVNGSVMALLDNGATTATAIPRSYCFGRLFKGSTGITSVGNILPATTLTLNCYNEMFMGCSNLRNVPKLSATTLANWCYAAMFKNCTSLTTVPEDMVAAVGTAPEYSLVELFAGCTALTNSPELKCTSVGVQGYGGMFNGCTALRVAPALPATTLASGSYQYMFYNCRSLTRIPSLPARVMAENCYWCMFGSCTGLGFNTAKTGSYQHAFRCPSTGVLTEATNWNLNMFIGTATVSTIGAPEANEYYYSTIDVYPDVPEPNYLIFTANQANCSVGIYKTGTPLASRVWYSRDGQTWTGMQGNVDYYVANVGDKFYMKGNNPSGWSTDLDNYWKISVVGDMSVSGSVMSLLDRGSGTLDTIPNEYCFLRLFMQDAGLTSVGNILTATTLKPYCYRDMFWNANNIASVPVDLLPASTMVEGCYRGMLVGTKITTIPNLPSTTLATDCYAWMFDSCTSLTSIASTLPATETVLGCYKDMFNGCSSLASVPSNMIAAEGTAANYACCEMFKGTAITVSPELKCLSLGQESYGGMFSNCTSLQTAPALPATTLGQGCYQYMFYNCTSLTRIPSLPATVMAQSCYWRMFMNCSNLGFNATKTGTYPHAFRCPSEGTLTTATGWNDNMFEGTATVASIPAPNANTFYYCNTDVYPDVPEPVTADYLCFTANTAGSTIGVAVNGTPTRTLDLWYSTDKTTWTQYTPAASGSQTMITLANVGDKIYWKGVNSSGFSKNYYIYYRFKMTGSFAGSGSVMSLIDGEGAALVIPSSYCFRGLFNGCTSLTSIPELPATTLANYCYQSMFSGCTSLTTAPALPATTLAIHCYEQMFYNCTAITTPPVLPATTLAGYCYHYMFSDCTSLTTAPALPAMTLADYCYWHMFNNCTSLTTAPALPATTLAGGCYHEMFMGCTGLITTPELPATTLAESCYGHMFYNCTSLTTAPALPAMTLADKCYYDMFNNCTSLISIPELPATTMADYCYYGMFNGCSHIKLSTTQTGEYVNAYRIPKSGTGTTATSALTDMFGSTGGTFTGTPSINTTYYTSNTIIE